MMKKSILNLGKALDKAEQKTITGGVNCPIYTPYECQCCGGYSLPNGCCLGTVATHACLVAGGGNCLQP